jgi:hypothetical protein
MDDNLIMAVVLGFLAYELLAPRSTYTGIVPGQPFTPMGTSVIPGTNLLSPAGSIASTPTPIVTSSLVIPAQSAINMQVSQLNQDIGAGAALGTAGLAIAAAIAGPASMIAAVAGPIGAAIAAVALIVKNLISDIHLYANQLVQRYENPFGNAVLALIQEVNSEWNAGTLTVVDALAARNGLQDAWDQYEAQMHQIQTQGTDWYIVATQSLNNLDNQYLGQTLPNGKTLGAGMGGAYGNQLNYGFMSSWLDWMNRVVSSLGGS